MIGIQGLESESVKKKFRFSPILIPTDVYRGKNHSILIGLKVYQMLHCFNIPMLIISFLGSRLDYLVH